MPNEVQRREKRRMAPIAALERGLDVLLCVGCYGADPVVLAKATGINRTTVYRILLTLEHAGFLARSPSDHRYRLTQKVRLLSDGFTDALWIGQIAMPALFELLRETSWPGNIATFDGRHMVFRESTHRFGAYLVHRPMIGRAIPLSTAMGQAFLAFSSEALRRSMLDAFIQDWVGCGFGALDRSAAERQLEQVRRQGFAVAVGALDPQVGALAMPVVRHGQVLACINVAAPPRVIETPALCDVLRDGLRKAATQITAELDRSPP